MASRPCDRKEVFFYHFLSRSRSTQHLLPGTASFRKCFPVWVFLPSELPYLALSVSLFPSKSSAISSTPSRMPSPISSTPSRISSPALFSLFGAVPASFCPSEPRLVQGLHQLHQALSDSGHTGQGRKGADQRQVLY